MYGESVRPVLGGRVPPHSCCPLGSDSERSFFSQCQSGSAGEGGREGGQAGKQAVGGSPGIGLEL